MRCRALLSLVPGLLGSCAVQDVEQLSSLAAKPALPYSVMITGGGFVNDPVRADRSGPLARTYDLGPGRREAFSLDDLQKTLGLGRVFVSTSTDGADAAQREVVSGLEASAALDEPALRATLERARGGGHDLLLVIERIADGAVEERGVNDRWPFTVGLWLFALGAFVPDVTYESGARLRVSMRDVYSGRRLGQPILVEAGPVDLDMFDRCGIGGFVQSLLIPPFWTSTDDAKVVTAVRAESTARMLISLVRRLKSVEVIEQLRTSGPAVVDTEQAPGGWQIRVAAREPLSSVSLRLDGSVLPSGQVREFERRLLDSMARDGDLFRYDALLWLPVAGRRLQVSVQTEAARVRSTTIAVEGGR